MVIQKTGQVIKGKLQRRNIKSERIKNHIYKGIRLRPCDERVRLLSMCKNWIKHQESIIDQLEADKLELSKVIAEVSEIQKRTYGSGMRCHLDMITYVDENKKLLEEANKYIKEVEK